MYLKNLSFLNVFLLIFSANIFGSPWSLTLSAGITRNFQPDVKDLSQYSFIPEFQMERSIISFNEDKNWISGSVYYAWWDDFVKTQTVQLRNFTTYSDLFSTIGLRVLMNSRIHDFYYTLFSGISENYIQSDYIGGGLYDGFADDKTDRKTYYQLGFNLYYSLGNNINVGAGAISEFQAVSGDNFNNTRNGLRVILKYHI